MPSSSCMTTPLAMKRHVKNHSWLLVIHLVFMLVESKAAFASRQIFLSREASQLKTSHPVIQPDCALFHYFERNETLFGFYHCSLSAKYVVTTSKSKYNVFLLRLVSDRHISTTMSERIDDMTYLITYRAPHHGHYKAFIRVLMDAETFDLPNNCLANYVRVNHQFEISDELDAHRVVAMREAQQDEDCCWEFLPPLKEDEMLPYEGWDERSPWNPELASRLQFSKSPKATSHEEARECLRDKAVCFLGDSQTRHLSVAFNELFNSSFAAQCDKTTVSCSGENGAFFILHYPEDVTGIDYSACTHLLFNYGQWPASYMNGPAWPIEKYTQETKHFFDSTLVPIGREKKVFWMSSNPFPLSHYRVRTCPPTDWRFPQVLKEYNSVAAALARERGIEVIDYFDIMFHLMDASYDNAHYKQPSGSALAKLVLDRLCAS